MSAYDFNEDLHHYALTAEHIVPIECQLVKAFHPSRPNEQIDLQVTARLPELDVAILQLQKGEDDIDCTIKSIDCSALGLHPSTDDTDVVNPQSIDITTLEEELPIGTQVF
jgi:hypothetical protein